MAHDMKLERNRHVHCTSHVSPKGHASVRKVRCTDFANHSYSFVICNAREMSSVAVDHKGSVFLSTAA